MKIGIIAGALALAVSSFSVAQTGTFTAGNPLGTTNEAGQATPMSSNVKVFGSFRFAESCTFDPAKNLILAMNAGVAQDMQENDGYVSLLNPDGSVHTAKWIGNDRNGLTLNQPLGSAIGGGKLYVADIDHVRTFDLATGQPGDAWPVDGANGLNGIAVAADGTVYASNTRDPQRVYKVTATGQSSVFLEGTPLMSPNGVAIDNDGNVVVVNIGNNNVMTFNTSGELINTEFAAEGGITSKILVEALQDYSDEAQGMADQTERTFGQQTSTANGYADAIRALPAAPVPAPAPVAPSLPWQPALSQAAMEINGLNRGDGEHGDYVRLDEVRDALSRMRDTLAAAPAAPVVPVKFDRLGRADGASWSADFYPDGATPYATVTIDLRPGEDAGDLTARILAAVGRGP